MRSGNYQIHGKDPNPLSLDEAEGGKSHDS